jgi:hypothetical protein
VGWIRNFDRELILWLFSTTMEHTRGTFIFATTVYS